MNILKKSEQRLTLFTKLIFILSTSVLINVNAVASDEDVYHFVNLGVVKHSEFSDLELNQVDLSFTPEVSFGVGQSIQLNSDWQFDSEVSLNFSITDVSGFDQRNEKVSGNYKEMGIWGTGRFNYTSFSENITPFIELGIGAVQTQYDTEFGEEKNHGLAYKVITGVAVHLENKMSISLAMGVSDNDKF